MGRRQGHDLPQYTPAKVTQGMEMRLQKGLRLVEIFDSVQGEGRNAGVPMTFVRFSKCNLGCDFCDTPYERVAIEMSEAALLENLLQREPSWVLFTGGEPMLQLPLTLVQELRARGIHTTCETNGMVWNEAFYAMSHVTISPKLFYDTPANPIPEDKVLSAQLVQEIKSGAVRLDELRYLICGSKDDIFRLPGDVHLNAQEWYLSPLFMDADPDPNYVSGKGHRSPVGHVDPDSYQRCLQLLAKYRHCGARLSLQTHKMVGVR